MSPATKFGQAHKYDNLKGAVLERQGQAIRFHPTLLAMSAHLRLSELAATLL